MSRWYEDWGVWLISVVALIGLGILIGWDINEFQGASSIFASLGTFMLGIAALLAIPQWKKQELKRFQASIAAEMHANLAEVRHRLISPVSIYQQAVLLPKVYEISEPQDSKKVAHETRETLEKELYKLSRVLNSAIIPRSALLGLEFSTYSRDFGHELAMLLTSHDWNKDGFERMNKVVDGLNELITYLESIVLFKE
ncbi:hypothetical protein J6J08_05380 [Pseudidiomarina sp. 1APR75-33.1]|uniref:hypothetical protein n=1 Tax=Pseudidiomarina terrestris TaxID=2820060 RepID=UPI00264C0594|nr:hypothetical protein [Pseudidiomarina sp. 1APR75-33.1]MDN7126807.1 hypothetical protein [Pseudidiomarina sp. 1APR75-33.1]